MSAAVTDRSAQRALVERFARERPHALLHDPDGPSILDLASGKTLPLDWSRISHVAEGANHDTGAPFLSLLIDDCLERGRDYHAGGARYNSTYIQGVGLGTLTDSLSAIRCHVFEDRSLSLGALVDALDRDFAGEERLRQMLINHSPRYGNDDDRADRLHVVFQASRLPTSVAAVYPSRLPAPTPPC